MTAPPLTHDALLRILGYPHTRVGKMVALLLAHQEEIDRYEFGSVELHFRRDEVKPELHVSWPRLK